MMPPGATAATEARGHPPAHGADRRPRRRGEDQSPVASCGVSSSCPSSTDRGSWHAAAPEACRPRNGARPRQPSAPPSAGVIAQYRQQEQSSEWSEEITPPRRWRAPARLRSRPPAGKGSGAPATTRRRTAGRRPGAGAGKAAGKGPWEPVPAAGSAPVSVAPPREGSSRPPSRIRSSRSRSGDGIPRTTHSPQPRAIHLTPHWRSAGAKALAMQQRSSRPPTQQTASLLERRLELRSRGAGPAGTPSRSLRRSQASRTRSSSSSLPSNLGLRSVKGAGKATGRATRVQQPASATAPDLRGGRDVTGPGQVSSGRSLSSSTYTSSSSSQQRAVDDPQAISGRVPPLASAESVARNETRARHRTKRNAERRRKRRAQARRAKGQVRLDEIQARVAAASSQDCPPPPATPQSAVVYRGTWTTVFTMDPPAPTPGPPAH